MHRLKNTVLVKAPIDVCFREWRNFSQFPLIFKHVVSVREIGENRWHWVIKGPLGREADWDAIIDMIEPNKVISWHSPPESDVATGGSVNFTAPSEGVTRIDVDMTYSAPVAPLGEFVADATHFPDALLGDELERFRQYLEQNFGSHYRIPYEMAKEGHKP